ncbi:major facilitator superfamily domain-containing protein [Aspergillus filifer]
MATNSLVTGAMIIVTASMSADLNMSQAQITWISAATTLTAGAFQLLLGQLTDILGRKPLLILGSTGFSASALLLGFAGNAIWMDIVAGLLGLFSALVVPPAAGILGAAYDKPSKRKNLAFACFSAGTLVGFGLGRAGFWVFAVVWAFLTVLSFWVVSGAMETYEVDWRFDFLGTFLTVFGVCLVTTGLTLGPSDGWKTGHLIPTTLLSTTSLISSNFWLALFLQEQQHLSPLPVAVRLLPQVIFAVLANIVAANILHRVNNTAIMAFGAAMYVLANALLAVQSPNAIYWAFIFPSLITNVLGLDLQFNVANSLPSNQQSLAAGIFNMFIRLGTTIGLGPFKAAFYVSVALAVTACLFVLFLRIGRHGVSKE